MATYCKSLPASPGSSELTRGDVMAVLCKLQKMAEAIGGQPMRVNVLLLMQNGVCGVCMYGCVCVCVCVKGFWTFIGQPKMVRPDRMTAGGWSERATPSWLSCGAVRCGAVPPPPLTLNYGVCRRENPANRAPLDSFSSSFFFSLFLFFFSSFFLYIYIYIYINLCCCCYS